MHSATRYHDISCGHRVVGHEGKCQYLHGHNYRFHFTVVPDLTHICDRDARDVRGLDSIGRVVDFSVIKRLGDWLEVNWDHKMLLWASDPLTNGRLDGISGIIEVPFNPTAENIARHLVEVVGPKILPSDVKLIKVTVEETRKCSATYEVG